MSLNIKNQKCVVCSAYLFDEDDIVYCPICGAPHHRDCYNGVGKCGLDSLHGTDSEYKHPEAEKAEEKPLTPPSNEAPHIRKCRGCGMPLDEDSRFCNNCGLPVNMGGSIPFTHFNAGVDIKDSTPISEGVTVADAAKVVKTNSFRYIPKFFSLNRERKGSWNWAAFLLPHAWFAYRKMYKESIITTLLMIVSIILNFPFSLALAQLPLADDSIKNYVQLAEYYTEFLGDIGMIPIILSFIGMALSLVIRIVCGIYGDWIYRERVVLSASLIKDAEDEEEALNKYSGTSFIGFFIAVCSAEFIPTLLSMFLI